MRAITLLLAFAFFPLISTASKKSEYVCTPDDAATQIAFGAKSFAVSITENCINLRSLEDKTRDWSWKVTLRNSLGDKEGGRQFCNRPDDGFIGYPAVWRQDKLKLIAFDPSRSPNSFTCYEFNQKR